MKTGLASLFVLLIASTSFANILNCEGYKEGNPTGTPLRDTNRDAPFPFMSTQIDGIDMQVMIPHEQSLTLRLVNSQNKAERATVTLKDYTQNKDFNVSAELSTASGIYRIICK